MCAARVDHKDAVWRAVNPDAVLLLELRIHAQTIFFGIADFEAGRWLEQSTRQKETEESQEPCHEECSDGTPHQSATLLINFAIFWTD